jgi:hypothetical protein
VADGELPQTVYRWVFKQRSIPALTALRANILDTQGRFGTVVGMFSALKAALRHVWKVLGHPGVFGVSMPVLLGVGLAMTYGGDFALGICVLILAALWSASFWLDSSLLKKKNPRRPRPRISDYEKATSVFRRKVIGYRCWQASGVFTVLCLLGISIVFIYAKRTEKELASLSGYLVPADELTPDTSLACPSSQSPDAVKVFFDGAVSAVSKFPHVIFSAEGEPRLVINRQPDGSIGLDAEVVSSDGRVIAEIRNNEFIVNPNNYLQKERNNRSTLTVRDQYGKTVLDVKYLNRSSIVILSFIVYVKTGDVAELSPSVAPGMCFGNGDSNGKGDFDFNRNPGEEMKITFKPYTGLGPVHSGTTPPSGGKINIFKVITGSGK